MNDVLTFQICTLNLVVGLPQNLANNFDTMGESSWIQNTAIYSNIWILIINDNYLFLICGDLNHHDANWLWVGYASMIQGIAAKGL